MSSFVPGSNRALMKQDQSMRLPFFLKAYLDHIEGGRAVAHTQTESRRASQDQQGLHAHSHRLRKRSPKQLCFALARAFIENMENDKEL